MNGLFFTTHTTELNFTVPGLSDRTQYWYQVTALDEAGNEIGSNVVSSIQDSSSPTATNMKPLPDYISNGTFMISYEPSVDTGSGDIEYMAEIANDPAFGQGVMQFDWTADLDQLIFDIESYEAGSTRASPSAYPLPDGDYYVHVRSRDSFGQVSVWGPMEHVYIDTTAPPVTVMTTLNEYSGGSSVMLSWEPVQDAGGEEVEYRVIAIRNDTQEQVAVSPWMTGTSYLFGGLRPYVTYDFVVEARDNLGHISDPSGSVMTTMDVTPPFLTFDNEGIFAPSDIFVHGYAEDGGCGLSVVEISFDGGSTFIECDLSDDEWTYMIEDVPEDVDEVLVRAVDLGGNYGSWMKAYIDRDPPEITVLSPVEGAVIDGPVQIIGSVEDAHLASYRIEYRSEGTVEWSEMVPMQTTAGINGILGSWLPDGLAGGDYVLRVTALDILGHSSTYTWNVTLGAARLVIDPSMITFSDNDPLPGDKVTALITISNIGGSDATDLTVVVYDGEEEIGRFEDVTVPAYGVVTIPVTFTAEGKHVIWARASSDLYNTGEMEEGAVLNAAEKEMVLEDFGGIMACLALLFALLAILLALVLGLRKGKDRKEKKETKEKKEEKKEEAKPEVKKEEPKKETPPPQPEIPAPPKTETLPPPSQPQAAALPAATTPTIPLTQSLPPPSIPSAQVVQPQTMPMAPVSHPPAASQPPVASPPPPMAAPPPPTPPQPPQPEMRAAPPSPTPVTYVSPSRAGQGGRVADLNVR